MRQVANAGVYSVAAGLLQANGTTLANALAVDDLAGRMVDFWEAGAAFAPFNGNRCGDTLVTQTYPSVGGTGKSLSGFNKVTTSTDRRTSNDDLYVVLGRGIGGVWYSYNATVRAVMLWDEELNVTQMYDLHARMAKQMNDV
jgi:hypothetical protein